MSHPHRLNELLAKCATYLPEADIAKIQEAYEYSLHAHEGQLRKSGEPYIIHPLEVAYILADLFQDQATICAGLLHDTIEDSDLTQEMIAQKFGEEVGLLVDGVTKLGKIYFGSKEEEQAENLRKMFLAMARDIRVVIIKIADRLHNMKTLKHLPPAKQLQIAKETREIFSPLAHRLGMWSLKWQLEDLAFYYLEHEDFQKIKTLVSAKRDERETYLHEVTHTIKKLIEETKLAAKVSSRPKHFYSIYNKMKSQNLEIDELYDMLGVRILVDSIKDCYEVLGLIHTAFKPINGRFKDYIAMPKTNRYQSLHTTVIGDRGRTVEFQIRTKEMHRIAEFGIAAHWAYKEGSSTTNLGADLGWIQDIVDTQEASGPNDYLRNLKMELFIDEVFVFTPKGDIHVFPRGATPIDLAYKIHTDIGHACRGAKVSGKIVPLDYMLVNGDQIEIMRGNYPRPNLAWLNFAHTSHAKVKIKQYFKKKQDEQGFEKAKLLVEKAVLVAGLSPKELQSDAIVAAFKKRFNIAKLDELYSRVAEGEISTKDIVGVIKAHTKPPEITDLPKATPPAKRRSTGHVRVLGEDNIETNLAKCCNPLPGDAVTGFVTIGRGISVHRIDCPNILKLEESDRPRIIEVDWDVYAPTDAYSVTLEISAFDRIGILQDIISRISETKTNIKEVKTKTLKHGGSFKASIVVEVRDTQHLNNLIRTVGQEEDIFSIGRAENN